MMRDSIMGILDVIAADQLPVASVNVRQFGKRSLTVAKPVYQGDP